MLKVNLVGNPNTGKTTLFNSLTRSDEHVGNWHGVTVEEKSKKYKYLDKQIELVDLPGIYSLSALSYEEEVAVKKIIEDREILTINICDENNIARNLYLTLGLMELGVPIILAVNQIDRKSLFNIDYQKLSKELGIPIVPINAEKKKTLKALNDCIVNFKKCTYNLPYIKELNLNNYTVKNQSLPSDFIKLKLLEHDDFIKKLTSDSIVTPENSIEMVARVRYHYVDKLIKECSIRNPKVYGHSKLDKFIMNKYLAFPIFLLILTGIFYLTFFSLGSFLSGIFSDFIKNCIGAPLVGLLRSAMGDIWFVDLVEVGIVGGVGSLVGFLPQIVLLFLFLSLLEDSGYLSRIAFIFEDIFSKVGLSGKSVYTLLMGFGCSTTAALTARNMEDENAKIKTAMLTPYMSCSAKLPIYAVLGGAFFGASNVLYVLMLYLLGVIVAITLSYVLEKTVLKSKKQSFILEFPPYRIPKAKRVLKVLWLNLKQFLIRIGSLIVSMNIIVWLLGSFSFSFAYVKTQGGVSMLESMGRFFSPIFAPLGFNNWGLTSALIAGLIAKEVVVSSIAMFNGINSSAGQSAIQNSIQDTSSVCFFASPAAALSYMVFCLLYSPCLATVSVLKQEIGKKWLFVSIVLQLVIAYICSFVIFNIFRAFELFGFVPTFFTIIGILIITIAITTVVYKIKHKKLCGNCKDCHKCHKK